MNMKTHICSIKIIFLNFWIVGISFSGLGQYKPTISSDRPGQAYSAYTVGKNIIQTQSGFNFIKSKTTDLQVNSYVFVPEFRYGITEKFEIGWSMEITGNYFKISDIKSTENGISNWGIGARLNIWEDEGAKPALGVLTVMNFTNWVSEEFDTGLPTPAVALLISKSCGDLFTFSGNLGAAWNGLYKYPTSGTYVLNFSCPITNKWGIFLENYGEFGNRFVDTFIDGGFSYLLNQHIQLDTLFGYGKNDGVTEIFISAGISMRRPRKSK
jgi:hypothetical protein